ncbi:helix-turn-helix domain-containing protein [Lacticaseibacillus baoqingensis]|uniref:Helix-turn-helix domain-containing protein n=1 Tax=Lacticaseibacillus baoqingensis TaxID=2486013 RepID=A0ABW4E7J7_9LACO|nr:helix-turn-helix domain-containing protein [Lacticaseibacillus baoqingensis]
MPENAKVLLDHSAQLKYQLYRLLAKHAHQDVTITDLAMMNQANYQPTYAVFQEILADVTALVERPRVQVRKELLKAAPLPVSLDAYRSFLVRHSLPYRLVDYCLTGTTPSLEAFCQREFVSRSTVSRKLRPLTEMMAGFRVKLKLATLTFTGPETNIRYLFYALYWWAHRGCFWPFVRVDEADVKHASETLTIMHDLPLAKRQQQYFLAVCRLRAGKGACLADNPVLMALARQVTDRKLRHGGVRPPLNTLDAAFFNFYQLTQPRFDVQKPPALAPQQELALLTTPETKPVLAALQAQFYRPQSGAFSTELRLNLLRLIFGYCACGGDFPQAQDIIGQHAGPGDDAVEKGLDQLVQALPKKPIYAGIKRDQARFVQGVARLIIPYLEGQTPQKPLRVRLDVDQLADDYPQLVEFVSAVPWVAQVTTQTPDVVVGIDDPQHGHPVDFPWYPHAMAVRSYRDHLMAYLLQAHANKRQKMGQLKTS